MKLFLKVLHCVSLDTLDKCSIQFSYLCLYIQSRRLIEINFYAVIGCLVMFSFVMSFTFRSLKYENCNFFDY